MKAKQIERDIETTRIKGVIIPAFAYARVSSKEQEREGYSIPVQLKRVREYAERHGFTIVAEYVDVETAKEPGRREFSRMVEAARHDATIGAIICEKVDRLCRNLRDYLTIDELPAKTLFWQQDFPDNAAGKLSFGMMVLLAKHYIDNLSDEVKKGMAEKVQEGGFPHQAPLGYRNAREGDRQVVVLDPIKGPMVRRAYELYATRAYSLKTLRKKLRDEGLATTKQAKLISLSQLQWLLKNPFYYGDFRWKGRMWAGSHPPLVSRELWDAVQAAFSAHEKPVYQKHDFAYKGLLICGSCGRHLTAELKKKRYVYYHCAGEEACRKTYIREEQLDEQVRALLASIAIPEDVKAWLLQGIARSREEQRAYHQAVVGEIRTEIKEQELLMDRLYDDRLHRLIAEDFFRQRFDVLEEKRRELTRDLARHQHAEGAYMEVGSKLIELIAQAPQIFERADPEQRRELVGLLTSNRVLKGRTLEFELRKPFDALVTAANIENGWVGRIRTQYNDKARRPDMTSAEVRQRFLNFFKERDHKVLPSSPLIPFGDPTLLFTSAGMVPFKPYFLGQAKPPFPRVTTCQKVFRTVDIDVVGSDGHHLTFFEMLGNFSFGDYFKEKAIPYAYEFLIKELRLDEERLWAGIHNDDDESFDIWKKTGIPEERIRRFGDEYNFWAAGPTGPCGPDSEIHYDWGEEYSCGRPDCGPNCEHCDRFLEVWNLVFIQWNRDELGTRSPLARKGIDTGMGLERITAVVNRYRKGVFETDAFQPLITHFSEEAGKAYGSNPDVDASLRVLADHARGSVMLLADGVAPANDGRGYVLRRLIRRGMAHARRLGPAVHLSSGVPIVARLLGDVYPEVKKQVDRIAEAVRSEEERFGVALRQGIERLEPLLERGTLNPEEVFYLHDTLGFPIELTTELAKERGLSVDLEAVAALMQSQRDRSRGATGGFTAPLARSASRFVGYDRLESDATVTDVFPLAGQPDHADVFLDETPFYAERGGQTADTGSLTWNGTTARVIDVQPQGEAIRHRVEVATDRVKPGDRVHAAVDAPRRQAVARHHSATHLLHRALRDVLGEEAVQAGSSVQPDYATFDFRFPRALTAGEVDRVSRLLNEKIRADLVRRVEELPLDQAIKTGAVALFDEKYGDLVRVVSFGDWARELCGGTHVERSGEIGLALISNDRSIGAGVRRIEMRAGAASEQQVRENERVLRELGDALRAAPADLPSRLAALQAEVKRLEKEAASLRQKLAAGGGVKLEEADVAGVRLMLQRVDDGEKDLLLFADQALNRANGNGVAIVVAGRNFAVKVAGPLSSRLPVNDLVQAFRQVVGGKGGGKGQVGAGGGIDPARVDQAFTSLQDYVREHLKENP